MKATPEGLKINELALVRVDFERVASPKEQFQPVELEFNFNVQQQRVDSKHWIVSATIELFPDAVTVPFRLSLTYRLSASVDDDAHAERLEKFTNAGAISTLLPFMRESIAMITMKSGLPPLLLPPMNVATLLSYAKDQPAPKADAGVPKPAAAAAKARR